MTEQPNSRSVPSPPRILILGMHRSGTSVVARAIAALGAFPGEANELLPAHARDNPAGYWERTDLVIEHDRFFESVGHAWNRVAYFDAEKLDSAAVGTLQENLRGTLRSLDSHGATWFVKDPRLSVLLPLWLPLVGNAVFVVVVRDPLEIASSMRDTHRGVLTSQFPLLLWEKYTRSLLRTLSGHKAIFVSYAALVADPRIQIERLKRGLESFGIAGLSDDISPSELVNEHLRRSSPPAHLTLTPAQAELNDWLVAQTRKPSRVEVSNFPIAPTPDALLSEFEAAFDHHIAIGRTLDVAETHRRLETIESTLRDQSDQLRQQSAEYSRQVDNFRSERDRLAAALSARTQTFESERERLVNALDEHQLALISERAKSEQLQAIKDAADTQLGTLQQQFSDAKRHAGALDETVRAIRASWSWKLTSPLRLPGKLRALCLSINVEQALYRFYYRIPGLSPKRKRGLILWLHRNARWLTHGTFSYRLAQQSQVIEGQRIRDSDERERLQRMDTARSNILLSRLSKTPLISIVMPVFNVEKRWLMAAVDSVRRQFYPHWELCIVDDASSKTDTKEALKEIEKIGDIRIKIRHLTNNSGIAIASNAALEMATGEFVGFLDHDDALTRDALIEVAQFIAQDDPDFLYSDEDKLDASNEHVEVHCKPDFSPDYFFSLNYICHFTVIRRVLLTEIGGFREGFDGAQDYDLFLRATEKVNRIAHIPKVLYHWRKIANSTATVSSAKPKSADAGRRALIETLSRRHIDGTVDPGPFPNSYRVRRKIVGRPLVSILIPFRDKAPLLDVCITSILKKTTYANYEILCVDNASNELETQRTIERLRRSDSRVKVVTYDAPFNYSAVNNFGVMHCTGTHLLFLNNDTEVVSGEWLEAMLEHSQRPEVGIVGARLLYEDDTIQHAGVIIGPGGVAGHAHLFTPGDDPGYFSRIRLIQNLSAVTFACAMTRRDVFEKVGGLNSNELKIAFNDIDYCLRTREAGYLVVYTPFAVLHHFESKSRGYEDTPEKQARFTEEVRYMQRRHSRVIEGGDPYYNPGLSLSNTFHPDPNYVYELPR